MKDIFKNKTAIVILSIVVVLAIVAGGYFFVSNKSKTNTQDEQFVNEPKAESLAPEKIGLAMEANASKKSVRFSIDKADGIKSIEYQLTYEANSTAAEQSEGGDARVQRGITGDAVLKSGESSYQSDWLDLGSCSKNICRYDTGVKSVMITLKVVKDDGKVYQVEKTLEL